MPDTDNHGWKSHANHLPPHTGFTMIPAPVLNGLSLDLNRKLLAAAN